MDKKEKPIANPSVVLREEFDDWAVLFDPDTGAAHGLNPIGVYVWKLLDGEHSLDALLDKLLQEIRGHADEIPENTEDREDREDREIIGDHIGTFVDALVAEGLAGFDITPYGPEFGPEKNSSFPQAEVSAADPFTYAPPQLVNLRGERAACGANCTGGSGATNTCSTGNLACSCSSGTGRSAACCAGACDGVTCCAGACDNWGCNNGGCTTYCGSGSSVTICNSGAGPTGGTCWSGSGGS